MNLLIKTRLGSRSVAEVHVQVVFLQRVTGRDG